jgi:hypothetical protein
MLIVRRKCYNKRNRSPDLFLLLVAASICGLTPTSASATTVRFPGSVTTISATDLEQQNGGGILDFAISPDNTTIAIAFEMREDVGKLSVWLGKWDIASRKLVAKVPINGSIPPELTFIGPRHSSIQYAPDGSAIVVQVGNQLYAYEAIDLKLRFAVSDRGAAGDLTSGAFGQLFAVSANGNAVATLSGQSEYPINKVGSVGLYELRSGKELSRWPAVAHFATLSLSPDGTRLLATVFEYSDSGDILLLDSMSGRLIKSFVSSFEHVSSRQGASNAVFLDGNHFVVSPSSWIDRKGNYPGSSLKAFDSRTGQVTADLTYDKFGPSGDVWVSSRDSTVVTLNVWMSHLRRRFNFTEGGPKRAQFLFFHPRSGGPFCVIGPLPAPDSRPRQSGFIRFSPDLGLVGLFVNGEVTIYSIPECKGP